MTNFNFQGKIIRHFWGKLIRQSTRKKVKNMRKQCLQSVTWGGCLNYQNGSLNNTFFHYDIRAG